VPEATEEATEEPSLKDRIKNKFVSGVKDLKAGFDDNVSTSLAEGDLLNNIVGEEGVPTSGGDAVKKGIMNRVGELAGTTVRTLGKPAVQGLIATGISKAKGNDWGKSIETGLDYAKKRQVADYYYKALNPEAKFTPLFSGLGADDYKAVTGADYKVGQLANQRARIEAQLDKSNPKAIDHANVMLGTGQWSLDEYNNFLAQFPDKEQRISLDSLKQGTNEFKANNQNIHWQNMDANSAERNKIIAQRNAVLNSLGQQKFALDKLKLEKGISDEEWDRKDKALQRKIAIEKLRIDYMEKGYEPEEAEQMVASILGQSSTVSRPANGLSF
jgi:hypothetical protein